MKFGRRSLLRDALIFSALPILAACAGATPTAAPTAVAAKPAAAPEKPAQPAAAAPAAAPAVAPANAPSAAPAAKPAEGAKAIELRVHTVEREPHSGWLKSGFEKDVDGWKSKHPNVTLKVEAIPGFTAEYTPKVLAMASGKQLGDVMWYPSRHRSNIAWGTRFNAVRDLHPLAKSANYDPLKNFYPSAIEASTLEGKLYWLNYIGEPVVPLVAYNKTKATQLGIGEPKDDWVLDDWITWAKAGTKNGLFGYSRGAGGNNPHSMGPFLRQHGVEPTDKTGKKSTFLDTKDAFVAALKYRSDLTNSLKVSPTPTGADININEIFGGQKVLAAEIWPNSVQFLKTLFKDFEIEFVTTPVVKKGEKRRSMLNEHGYGVTTFSQSPEVAFDYLTWICGREMQVQAFALGNKAPAARPDVWNDERIYEKYPAYRKLKPTMEAIEADYIVANFRGEEFDAAFAQAYDKMELGSATPDVTAAEIQRLTQAVLDKAPA